MLVYAIRHAESEANAGRTVGLDCDLTDLGREQAGRLAARFSGVRCSGVYSSPLRRAIRTAVAIAETCDLPVRLRPELFEHHHLPPGEVPDFQMPDAEAVAARFRAVEPDPDLDAPIVWPPIVERAEALVERMAGLAASLKARWTEPDDVVVLVSHGSPIARFIDAWLSDDRGRSFRYIIDNGAVTALRHHAGISSLVCLNEASHLRGLPAPSGANFDERGRIKPVSPSGYW